MRWTSVAPASSPTACGLTDAGYDLIWDIGLRCAFIGHCDLTVLGSFTRVNCPAVACVQFFRSWGPFKVYSRSGLKCFLLSVYILRIFFLSLSISVQLWILQIRRKSTYLKCPDSWTSLVYPTVLFEMANLCLINTRLLSPGTMISQGRK